ncbi:MAG: FAD/NAD(P)-binding protein [Methylococcaceae bacterium]|nr:FAD/NAD(P)-binding protein [Methylococcaceae bacterium]
MNRPQARISCDVAIIGGGFAGTLVAAQLLRQARLPLTIILIERLPMRLGRGVAYGTERDCHLLNVPAGNMSALPEDPESFLRWAQSHEDRLLNPPWVNEVSPSSFLPRNAYGDYLVWLLEQAEQTAKPGVRLLRKIDEAKAIRIERNAAILALGSGESIQAQRVVLALGNFRPGDPAVKDSAFYRSPRYHSDPWAKEALAKVAETGSCLLVGSGLTMVDWAIALEQVQYRGTIHAVSRRGLWPKAHRPGAGISSPDFTALPTTARRLLGQIRKPLQSGEPWRAVIDALRPHSQNLWRSLPIVEKRRFLRHLRPYWDSHRHRIAPIVAEHLDALLHSGQLVRHSGRILGYREGEKSVEVTIRCRGSDRLETLSVDAVVNCSGSESDYRKLDSPLIVDLLSRGIVRTDPLSLGLDADSRGALLDAEIKPSSCLFTLGPPQKGILWETTAVPEIRVQAAHLAANFLGRGTTE